MPRHAFALIFFVSWEKETQRILNLKYNSDHIIVSCPKNGRFILLLCIHLTKKPYYFSNKRIVHLIRQMSASFPSFVWPSWHSLSGPLAGPLKNSFIASIFFSSLSFFSLVKSLLPPCRLFSTNLWISRTIKSNVDTAKFPVYLLPGVEWKLQQD